MTEGVSYLSNMQGECLGICSRCWLCPCRVLLTLTHPLCCSIYEPVWTLSLPSNRSVSFLNKPWMSREVRLLLKARNIAFRSGEAQRYKVARLELKRGIRDAKAAYKRRIEGHFDSLDSRRAWQGMRHITRQNYNNNSVTNSSTALAEELNHFLGRH